jgi:hypothetical protein
MLLAYLINELIKKQSNIIIPVYKINPIQRIITKLNDKEVIAPATLFKKSCMECHDGPSSFILLPLESMTKMANDQPTFSQTGPQERLEKNRIFIRNK